MSIGNCLEVLSQQILVGIISVGRLGVALRVYVAKPKVIASCASITVSPAVAPIALASYS